MLGLESFVKLQDCGTKANVPKQVQKKVSENSIT